MTNLDLKVLKAVHTLCISGSVTNTARLLHVSPGAISYLINKARKATGSALFFRTKNGMEPDIQAKELSALYLSMEQKIENAQLTDNEHARTMIISSYSLVELLLSISVLNDKNKHAPIEFRHQSYDDNERLIKLRNKEIDLDIGTRLPVDTSIVQLKFFAGNAGILASSTHSTIKEKITYQDWESNQHAIWGRGMHYINEDFEKMHRYGEITKNKQIAFTTSSSLNLINLCALSDILVLVPELVGRKLSEIMPVKWYPTPEELGMRYECYIHYHHTMSGNKTMKGLIDLFNSALAV